MQMEADYYFAAGDLVNWSRGLDQVGPIMQQHADRMYVIPGNHESEQDIATFCDQFGFHAFHGQTMEIGGYHVAGLGYSNPTPFDTPGEYTEDELATRLNKFDGLSPLILICHCPPKDTALDKAGNGQHYGSTAVGEFIERQQPEHFFCGHIHEAEGVTVQLGGTTATNVGKRGFLLEF